MSPRLRLLAAPAVAFTATAALGIGILALVSDDTGSIEAARAARSRVETRLARTQAERDRLRAERDQLEARLAASKAPPVCPRDFVSTGTLLPVFSVDYPCGWHVLYDPRAATAGERPGLIAEITLFSRVPLSFAPRAGAFADVELVQWSDNPSDTEDRLQPIARWVEDERAHFKQPIAQSRFEGGSKVTVYVLEGELQSEEETFPAQIALWEFTDPGGTRHVIRAIAISPSKTTASALQRVARSFTVFMR